MVGFLFVVVAAAVLVVLAAMLYWISAVRNKRTGARGFVQRSRLICPKCHQTFDYEWVPGVALTAVRLGRVRYMACPLCHRWSNFDVFDAPVPPPTA
ncbi:MAG TPA: hypothetical protein VGV89_03110 [Thermoplasmata archaeon]|nr:hypothetical protein [Thermoplasmata archaeon]